jgi:hypothetical protein
MRAETREAFEGFDIKLFHMESYKAMGELF